MGSGTSKQNVPILKCPDGFDQEKFKKICTLFDKLDKDSNLGVSSDELTNIAELHVKNCQLKLEKRLAAEKQSLERLLAEIDEQCRQKLEKVRYEADVAKQGARQQSQYLQKKMESKKAEYAALDEDGREHVFMKVLMPKDESHIDFWTFFEYMKTRTDDIENIKD